MTLYGIAACDTCRKARRALEAAGHAVAFRDLRADPLSQAESEALVARFGDRLVNRASATWRGLDAVERARVPASLIAAHPTVMKRPVIATPGAWHLGWSKAVREQLLE
ncbi:hypothetical protein C2I36_07305 [Rhodobacteraceae bacterium WD3A24]|nr:hypothetical protein C2I36_07305 [Rhodobacteraceae bacterium WD3A24]